MSSNQTTTVQAPSLTTRAQGIFKSLGARAAAGFLRNRNVPLEEALVILGMRVRAFK